MLLGFAAYRIHQPEHGGVADKKFTYLFDKKFTYLFELHKTLSDPRSGGLGDLLEMARWYSRSAGLSARAL